MEDKFLQYIQSRPKSAKSGSNYVSGINSISKKFLDQNLFSITSPEIVEKIWDRNRGEQGWIFQEYFLQQEPAAVAKH